MKQSYDTVNYDLLFKFSGDPFADIGGCVLKGFSEYFPDLDILELIMKATDIYVDNWSAKINTLFLNSKITQPAFDMKKKKEETYNYFRSIINNENAVKSNCRIFGNMTYTFPATRENSLLSGSGTFVNFHHYFQNGIMMSKEAIIRLFFLPLGCKLLQGKIAIIHSNSNEIVETYAKKCLEQNMRSIVSNSSGGILKSKSSNVGTSLFKFVNYLLSDIRLNSDDEDYYLSLYLFSNFGASPELQIYPLPSNVFSFYRFTQKLQYKKDWDSLVYPYFKNIEYKKAIYDNKLMIFHYVDGEKIIDIPINEFSYWKNDIYEYLLNNKSIISFILKYSRKSKFNWEIVNKYTLIIRGMKKETLEKIKQMADFIYSSNDENGVKKAINKLDGVNTSYLLRRFVLKDIVSKYYNEGNEKAIITLEDYADYLFPDTNSWQEIRDLLLIAIYQKLHENNVKIETDLDVEK